MTTTENRTRMIHSALRNGFCSVDTPIEVTLSPGHPHGAISIDGVPHAAAREITVRVRAALSAMNAPLNTLAYVRVMPQADMHRKLAGYSGLDLPIALAIAAAPDVNFLGMLAVGELALDGTVRSVRGTLLHAQHLQRLLICGPAQPSEAAYYQHSLHVASLESACSMMSYLRGGRIRPTEMNPSAVSPVKQLHIGWPGTGRTSQARRDNDDLAASAATKRKDLALVYNLAGIDMPDRGRAAPFRAPHHTVSRAGLLGNAQSPGEATLALHGTLLLDEATEFPLGLLESLFAALRRGHTENGYPVQPARVIATAHPCPCGYHGHNARVCRCSAAQIAAHRKRLQPLHDNGFAVIDNTQPAEQAAK